MFEEDGANPDTTTASGWISLGLCRSFEPRIVATPIEEEQSV
jgi:hypothetical protein